MNEMVERVARALEASCSKDYQRVLLDQPPLSIRGTPEELARVAIAAMRMPTGAMVDAGWPLTGDPCWEDDLARAWTRMVDTALAD